MLGSGGPYGGNGAKIRLVKQFLETEGTRYSHLLFCDAYDVVLAGGFAKILRRFASFSAPIVFSAEWNCWPDPARARDYPPSPTRYRFLNSGVWLGETVAAREMFRQFDLARIRDQMCDQRFFTDLFLNRAAPIELDYECRIAQSLHAAGADLRAEGGVVRNIHTGQVPLIFHGNGGTNMTPVIEALGYF